MDPLAITIEIFVVTVTGAIFGGMAMLIALDIITDRRVLKNNVVKRALFGASVQQVAPHIAQQTATNETAANIPKAA
jgi:hypothetical protein